VDFTNFPLNYYRTLPRHGFGSRSCFLGTGVATFSRKSKR